MGKFWTGVQKEKNFSFKNCSVVLGCVVNLCQLKAADCNVSSFIKFQDLSLVIRLCGLLVYEDLVRIFYGNLCKSLDSGEL